MPGNCKIPQRLSEIRLVDVTLRLQGGGGGGGAEYLYFNRKHSLELDFYNGDARSTMFLFLPFFQVAAAR